MKNRYVKHAHISEGKFKYILKCFSLDLTATDAAELTNISRKTINRMYDRIRTALIPHVGPAGPTCGEFEVDESYFGAKRIRGKRGRGAAGKTPVFGLLKRDGNVYVQIVANCSREALMPIIQGHILSGSKIFSDGWKAYDGLILNGYDHYRIFHSEGGD